MFLYGKTIGCLRLKEAVDEAEASGYKCHAKVVGIMEDLHKGLNFIETAPTKELYQSMYVLWKDEILYRASKSKLPFKVKDMITTAIQGIARRKRREFVLTHNLVSKNNRKILETKHKKHETEFEEALKKVSNG